MPLFWITLLTVIILLCLAYFAFFYSGLQIKKIVISGNNFVEAKDLENLVSNDSITGLVNFWDIKISSKSILFVNKEKISNSILEKFPDINKAIVSQKFPQTLGVVVTERTPVGAYCPLMDSNINCFYIDKDGVIFQPLSSIPADTSILRQAINNGQVFTGEKVINQNIISAIYNIKKNLQDIFQINLKEALITSPVRLNIKTDKNWQIYFDLSGGSDMGAQLTKLNLLLNGNISAESMKNLRYIDLRPKDRAIICDNSVCGQ